MNEFFAITLIIILAAISPGPDFALVVKNALLYTRKAGIYTALGVASSLIIHSVYCILGLAIIIAHSLLLFSIIKYLGAGYLIYIGIKSLFTKTESIAMEEHKTKNTIKNFQAFSQGLLCNLLNPKAIMFMLAFFTLIVKPVTPWLSQLGFAFEIALIHVVWFSWLAIMITHQYIKTNLNKAQRYLAKIMGVVLIGFGIRVAFIN